MLKFIALIVAIFSKKKTVTTQDVIEGVDSALNSVSGIATLAKMQAKTIAEFSDKRYVDKKVDQKDGVSIEKTGSEN